MAGALQVPHLLFFFECLFPHCHSQKLAGRSLHTGAERMCLDVEELAGCAAQKLSHGL